MSVEIIQINLQTEFGGGEVYTQFLTQTLRNLHIPTRIIVHEAATFWQKLNIANVDLIRCSGLAELPKLLGKTPKLLLSHGPLPTAVSMRLQHHCLTAIAHMPLTGRDPSPYQPYHQIIAVSEYVLNTLKQAGFDKVINQPLYGIANPEIARQLPQPIHKASLYTWDKRKGRDVLLSYLEPFYQKFAATPIFVKRPGLTLGIVSRLTPIKQFPSLFQHIAPVIRDFPALNLEIFGSGGYASIRDFKQALHPIKNQVRFWGQQWSVGSIYRQCDYILSGLPEREALGLNLLEAQACDTPVIAVQAPPFTETVNPNVSGLLYIDPRQDQAADFRRVMTLITQNPPLLNPAGSMHLARFTLANFEKTLYSIVPLLESAYNDKKRYDNHLSKVL